MISGQRYKHWIPQSNSVPSTVVEVAELIRKSRDFVPLDRLDYGDHGLEGVLRAILSAMRQNQKIALYADYDVDGTMSCVSWIWFFEAIGFKNYIHYIPCRFKEGYGVNLSAIKHLVESERAQVVITMDTGITANEEARWCKEQGVTFICTDHHKVQPEKMPDSLILNPKMHPDAIYQELCGCGITFVLLRKIAQHLTDIKIPDHIWTDILALTGMATICDVVPLNGVNHKLARMGVDALMKSRRPVLVKLLQAAKTGETDEKDVGFKLGPRINAVGRLEHADLVIRAFIEEKPDDLIAFMGVANERRRQIQKGIVDEARDQAKACSDSPILFLGGDWHPGVVGIAASKMTEEFWRPSWLFQRKDGICKGSARSIKGFDVTEAMMSCGDLFLKFGGHAAAGGFSFLEENEAAIRERLVNFAATRREADASVWESKINYDCHIPGDLLDLGLIDTIESLKPFGQAFEEPRFRVEARIKEVRYFNDKTTGEPRHTCVIGDVGGRERKIMFFNEVTRDLAAGSMASFVVSVSRNVFRGVTSLSMTGIDWARECHT
jgi:single-stranded-DNA-specific exonuclease